MTTRSALTLYVRPHGRDAWSGTLPAPNADATDGPLASLAAARDTIRRRKETAGLPAGGVRVEIGHGAYVQRSTMELTDADSGTSDAPIVYHAANEAVLTGGFPLGDAQPVINPAILARLPPQARGNVVCWDLADLGVTEGGHMRLPSGNPLRHNHLELFFDGRRMPLSRWPNEEWLRIVDLPDDSPRIPPAHKYCPEHCAVDGLVYEGDRPKAWASHDDIWIHGYFAWDWADSYERVALLDPERRVVKTAPPHHGYGYALGMRFRFLNVLEELDAPGQWYLDRARGLLYFWPPSPLEAGQPAVSVLDQPLLRIRDASHLRIEGLTLECVRGNAVEIEGGEEVTLAGCTLRNIGHTALIVDGGTGHQVRSCDIYQVGENAIQVEGGDRKKLTPGRHEVVNNHIHHYSEWSKCGTYAVRVGGVGNRIAHNLIHDAPFEGMYLMGNDHVIEYNELHSLALETGDVGGIHTGRNWTWRGNIIRYNYFHHMGGVNVGCNAVYLDDWMSGVLIYGNLFYKTMYAVFIGGGHDNTAVNNVFVDCDYDVHVDARGLTWAAYYFDGTYPTLFETLEEMNYQQPPYSHRYPRLLHILDRDPARPRNNRILRNIHWGPGQWTHFQDGYEPGMATFEDNLLEYDPCFVDAERADFRLRDGSPALALGFQPLPLEQIGLFEDEYRRGRKGQTLT